MRTVKASCCWVFYLLLACQCAADEQKPGIRLELRDSAGNSVTRRQDTIALVASNGIVDRRLIDGELMASWDGFLLVQSAGAHRFHAQFHGTCEVRVGNQVVISSSKKPEELRWIESEPVELQPGMVPIHVTYRATARIDQELIKLFWSGPGFEFTEPIGGKYLFHRPRENDSSGLGNGGLFAQSYRCNACHAYDGRNVLAAPALDKLSPSVIAPAWIVAWLAGTNGTDRHCPTYGIAPDEAKSVAAYLLSQSDGIDREPSGEENARQGDAQRGEVLFMSLGCLACHRVQASSGEWLGSERPFDGGDLTLVAAKRPPEFFPRWLADPAQLNVDHRMPVFDLSVDERGDLSAYLSTLGQPPNGNVAQDLESQTDAAQIVSRSNCAACHRLPYHHAAPMTKISHWKSPCSAPQPRAAGQPSFAISRAAHSQLRAYIERTQQTCDARSAYPTATAAELIEELNCLSCHSRGFTEASGLGSTATDVVETHAELAGAYAALIPPPLHQIGDKLTNEGLLASIVRPSKKTLRPWLRVRMPRFRLTDDEVQMLVQYFVAQDRLPQAANVDTNRLVLGKRPKSISPRNGAPLVGRDGFNCISCHGMGAYQPPNPPLNARGPNLSAVAGRVRPEWFVRWVRNPLRIVPNVEMPSIVTPVPGALGDRLDHQIAAVWQAMREPQYVISKLQPFRVLRQSGADADARAIILTDVLRLRHQDEKPQTLIKPFAIGLANRHNVLFDLASGRLRGWWLGDLAGQMNEGKVWYWQANMRNLLTFGEESTPHEFSPESVLGPNSVFGPDIVLVAEDGQIVPPVRDGQFITRPDVWKHTNAGVELRHRLRFAVDSQVPHQLHVRQTFRPLTKQSGFARQLQVEVEKHSPGMRVLFQSLPGGSRLVTSSDNRRVAIESPENSHVRIVDNRHRFTDDGAVELILDSDATSAPLRLEYTTGLKAKALPDSPPHSLKVEPTPLHIVPGFDAIRLPIGEPFMPTGLAWDPSGTMFVTSLDGRVWRVVDSDGDRLADAASQFSDELATPYGVVAGRDFVDVVDKTALLRLRDRDQDGQSDETMTLAAGWGHTDDYHDWVVGLERDAESNYYVAIPCQQDERSTAAAHLRGTVIQLKPRDTRAKSATPFFIRPMTGGHRFPHGIALNRDRHLFVTDNQGNFNPFNELNHVVPGRRYGFINRLERKPGFRPELTAPAINIPHPWTRSVNGICFLEPPSSATGGFGPFEGHVIGCEYDTRRLVRMTLQQVDGEFQGAVYPFSYDAPREGPVMQGPIVCRIAPDGDLYVGSLRESGWGGGRNTGEIVKLSFRAAELPAGIAEIRANKVGFAIEFTRDVERLRATDVDNYRVMSYRRISTPQYGGDDVDRREERVISVTMSRPNEVHIQLADSLRTGFVYEFRLQSLSPEEFFPRQGHYTLNRIPAK